MVLFIVKKKVLKSTLFYEPLTAHPNSCTAKDELPAYSITETSTRN